MKQKVMNLIAQGKIAKVFEQLNIRKYDKDLANQIVLLESQFNDYLKDKRIGVVSNEALTLRYNQITHGLTGIVTNLPDDFFTNKTSFVSEKKHSNISASTEKNGKDIAKIVIITIFSLILIPFIVNYCSNLPRPLCIIVKENHSAGKPKDTIGLMEVRFTNRPKISRTFSNFDTIDLGKIPELKNDQNLNVFINKKGYLTKDTNFIYSCRKNPFHFILQPKIYKELVVLLEEENGLPITFQDGDLLELNIEEEKYTKVIRQERVIFNQLSLTLGTSYKIHLNSKNYKFINEDIIFKFKNYPQIVKFVKNKEVEKSGTCSFFGIVTDLFNKPIPNAVVKTLNKKFYTNEFGEFNIKIPVQEKRKQIRIEAFKKNLSGSIIKLPCLDNTDYKIKIK